jgi:hypothetical protein
MYSMRPMDEASVATRSVIVTSYSADLSTVLYVCPVVEVTRTRSRLRPERYSTA